MELENMELEPHEEQSDTVEVQPRRSTHPTRPPSRLRDYITYKVSYPIQDYISYNKVSPKYMSYLGAVGKVNQIVTQRSKTSLYGV
jgi:hypothetical protein